MKDHICHPISGPALVGYLLVFHKITGCFLAPSCRTLAVLLRQTSQMTIAQDTWAALGKDAGSAVIATVMRASLVQGERRTIAYFAWPNRDAIIQGPERKYAAISAADLMASEGDAYASRKDDEEWKQVRLTPNLSLQCVHMPPFGRLVTRLCRICTMEVLQDQQCHESTCFRLRKNGQRASACVQGSDVAVQKRLPLMIEPCKAMPAAGNLRFNNTTVQSVQWQLHAGWTLYHLNACGT